MWAGGGTGRGRRGGCPQEKLCNVYDVRHCNEASHSRQGLNATRGEDGTAACEQDASQGRFSCKWAARNGVAMKDKKKRLN